MTTLESPMPATDALSPGFYWLHCDGPDGPCVLLSRYDQWTNAIEIIEDGGRIVAHPDGAGHQWSPGDRLHKWTICFIEPVIFPAFHRPASNPRD